MSQWELISFGDFPWISESNRNNAGEILASSYESGDANHHYMEATFFNSDAYMDYRISFPGMRQSDAKILQIAELELPGVLLALLPSSVDVGLPLVPGSAAEDPESSGSWIVSGSGWDIDVSLVSREA